MSAMVMLLAHRHGSDLFGYALPATAAAQSPLRASPVSAQVSGDALAQLFQGSAGGGAGS